MKNFLVLDFESLGTSPNSVVTSFGAYYVDVEQEIPSFDEIIQTGLYLKFDIQEQINDGRKVEKATIDWWEKQNDEAKKELEPSEDDVSYKRIFEALRNYLEGKSDYFVFARSPNFDFSLLDNIRKDLNLNRIWPFFNERDIRTFLDTMFMVLPFEEQWNKFNLPKELWPSNKTITTHHALYDVATDVKRMELVLELYAKLQSFGTTKTYTVDEIAKEIGTTPQTVKNIENRVINKIKSDFSEYE
jgi:hypothetical protein